MEDETIFQGRTNFHIFDYSAKLRSNTIVSATKSISLERKKIDSCDIFI